MPSSQVAQNTINGCAHRTVSDPLLLKEDGFKCGLLKFSRSMVLSARVFSSCIKHGSRLKGVSWDQDLASPHPEKWILLLLNTTPHHPNTRLLRIRLRVGISMGGRMQIYSNKDLKFCPSINMKVIPTDNLGKCQTDLSSPKETFTTEFSMILLRAESNLLNE